MKTLIDNGILSHAEFVELVIEDQDDVLWGDIKVKRSVHGYKRKLPNPNISYQNEIDALFTIGRLIREQIITAYSSSELSFEAWRGRRRVNAFNALQDCEIHSCPSPLERYKFRKTINFAEYVNKGGKKDRKNKREYGDASQIPFMDWLKNLPSSTVESILDNADLLGLSSFEKESVKEIGWFQAICKKFDSNEHLPDVFHLWTAERNQLDVFLTLDKKFSKMLGINENKNMPPIVTKVLTPVELLHELGITNQDDVPVEYGKIYSIFEYN
jgi:hypothetical protein